MVEPSVAKVHVEIERLVQWTFDELMKRQTSSADGSWSNVENYLQRGGVDVGHSSAQRYPHHGLPHPDAIKIEQAIMELPSTRLDWDGEAAAVLGPLIALIEPRSRKAQQQQSKRTSAVGYYTGHRFSVTDVPPAREVILVRTLPSTGALIAMHGKMNTRPDWQTETPIARPLYGARGKPVLVGESWGKRVYSLGSHCPLTWEPSPISIAEDRANYLAWWRGLAKLNETLDLDGHISLPPAAPEMPWQYGGPPEHTGTVFHHRLIFKRPLPLKPQRERAGPPLSKYKPRRPTGTDT